MTIPAKVLLIGLLQKSRVSLSTLLMITAIFQLCAPDPEKPLDPDRIAEEMKTIAERLGVTAEINIDLRPFHAQAKNASRN